MPDANIAIRATSFERTPQRSVAPVRHHHRAEYLNRKAVPG